MPRLRSVVGTDRYLSPEQAARVYNRIGRWQDTQGFYERPAVDALTGAGQFDAATHVVEVGCGTGALAARLLDAHLPDTARYAALDVSSTMVGLTQERLRGWSDRVRVERVDGHGSWPARLSCGPGGRRLFARSAGPGGHRRVFAEAGRVLRREV